MRKVTLIMLGLLLFSVLIFPQTDSSYIQTEEIFDDLLQESPEETDPSALYEVLEDLLRNPADINTASLNELQRVPYIDATIAGMIINHRQKYGLFFSTNELYSISDIPQELIKKIIPFVKVSPVGPIVSAPDGDEDLLQNLSGKSNIYLRSRVVNDLQTREGFTDGRYSGSKYDIYNRMQIKYDDNYQLGLLTEKDAGEKNLNEFSSYHFSVKEFGLLKNIVIGDYHLGFGQGLALNSPYGFSKGADAIYPVKRKDGKIRPYTSSTENNFFRGAAATVELDNLSFSAFFSKNKFDANIDSISGQILSTPIDGLHRTESEISKRKTAEETFLGGRIDYSISGFLRAGVLYYRSSFNHPFSQSSIFDKAGDEFSYSSFYYDIIHKNINIFGEAVYDGKSVASINNLQISITGDLVFISSIRSYPRNFTNLHGFGFGEKSGDTQNEFGIYTGIRWVSPIGIINFYYDQFKFPYATFDNPLPSDGNELLVDITSKPLNKLETGIRYRFENKEITETPDDNKLILRRLKQSIRTEVLYDFTKNLRWKGRFEYNHFRIAQAGVVENGTLIFQDLKLILASDINFYGRIIFFHTDSFNSAIYEYENDLTGALSNLAMFGEGIRWYFLLRYKPLKLLTLSIKYAETYKPKEKSLSSGDSGIIGNLDNRLSIQLDFNY